jgi:hypothetical protein
VCVNLFVMYVCVSDRGGGMGGVLCSPRPVVCAMLLTPTMPIQELITRVPKAWFQ